MSALRCCALIFHKTKDEIIIAIVGKTERGVVYVKIPLIANSAAKTQGHKALSTIFDFVLNE